MQPNLAAAPRIMKDTKVNGMWIIPPCLKRSAEVWRVTGESLHEGLERPLHEILKVKPGLYWIQEVLELWDVFKVELQTRNGNSSRQRYLLQAEKLKGKIHLSGDNRYGTLRFEIYLVGV